MPEAQQTVALPSSVAELADLSRVLRELEGLDDFLREAAIRKSPSAAALPKTTQALRDVAEVNHFNLLQPADRAKADRLLTEMRDKAPVAHISFAAEPSASFTAKIITYLRQNIHPQLLVQIGLQPTIAAGCVVRTENKVFDFSLRQHMRRHEGDLIKILSSLRAAETPAPVAPVQAAAVPPPVAAKTPAAAATAKPQAAVPSPAAMPAQPQEAKA